jgi:ABC-type transport system involved in cytochrome bd biosynthesis fused ATPase/permease subunit
LACWILNNEATVRHDRIAAPAYGENDPIFEVDHLWLAYPGGRGHPAVEILNDVSFRVERGHALTLVGPSGSGKSSVLRCLNRLVEPTSGTMRFDGRDIRSFDPGELRRRVALVMQTPVMFEGTVRDNLCIRPVGVRGDFSERRLAATGGGDRACCTALRANGSWPLSHPRSSAPTLHAVANELRY